MKDKRKTREKKPLSFAIYVMGAFLLTSAMTVLITAAAIAIVWNVGYAGEPGDEELFFAVFTAGAIALLLSVILGIYFAVGICYLLLLCYLFHTVYQIPVFSRFFKLHAL